MAARIRADLESADEGRIARIRISPPCAKRIADLEGSGETANRRSGRNW